MRLLIIVSLSLVMILLIEAFEHWYEKMLVKFDISKLVVRTSKKALFLILAIIFWETLVLNHYGPEISYSHFLFGVFLFSIYKGIKSVR